MNLKVIGDSRYDTNDRAGTFLIFNDKSTSNSSQSGTLSEVLEVIFNWYGARVEKKLYYSLFEWINLV